jgi:hypothetical protein
MVKMMHGVLLEATKMTFVVASFIAISANKVIIIDNT